MAGGDHPVQRLSIIGSKYHIRRVGDTEGNETMVSQDHHRVSAQRVTLPSGPVFYQQLGSGPPLLLIHGWGASSRYWARTLDALSDIRTCYAPDLPGYGETPPMEDTASIEQLAEVVIAFADAIGVNLFDLKGHSFGGAVAVHVAARIPTRVRHLILTCFGTFGTEIEQFLMGQAYYQMDLALTISKPWLMQWQPWMALWQRCVAAMGQYTPFPRAIALPFFYRLPADEQVCYDTYHDFMRMDYRTSLEGATSLANPSLRRAMQSITVPTLVIGARQDLMIMPSRVESTARLIPQARLAWLNQCGHLPMIECPQAYHRLVRNFLQQDEQSFLEGLLLTHTVR